MTGSGEAPCQTGNRERRIASLGVGHIRMCAVLNAQVKCWGRSEHGALGLGDERVHDPRELPAGLLEAVPFVDLGAGRNAKVLTATNDRTWALLERGPLECWGTNQWGRLGLGDELDRGTGPSQKGRPLTLRWVQGEASNRSAPGILGLGDSLDRGLDLAGMGDALPAVKLGTGRTAHSAVLGELHSCALLDDATVKCWGDNAWGQLGSSDRVGRGL